jgi:ParB/RepB/Spo0J family partition protein
MKSLPTATTGIFGQGPKPEKKAAVGPRKTTTTTTASSSATPSSANPNHEPTPSQGIYGRIAPHRLWRSATNRIVEKDDEYEKLRENIREHGILQPLVVRALPEGEWFVEPGTLSKVPGYFVNCRAYAQYVFRPLDQQNVSHPIWSQWTPPFFKDRAQAEENLPLYEIVIGEHRWTAALEIGLAEVPIIIRTMNDRSAILTQLSENLRRKNLKPLDEARGYQRMLDLGMKIEEIGKELGGAEKELSKSTIYARLKLLELPPTAMEAVEKGIIPASHAELITKLKTPEAQAALTAQILTPEKVWSSSANDYVNEYLSFRKAKELADAAVKNEEKEVKWQETTKEYRTKGFKVLSIEASGSVFNYGSLKSGYVGLNDKCDLDPKQRTWKALLGTHAPQTVVAYNSYDTNKVRLVLSRKAAEKALKLAGHESLVDSGAPKVNPEEKRKREQEKREEEQKIRRAIAGENIGKVVAAAESKEPNADFFRLILDAVCAENGIDEKLIERRQLPLNEKDGWQKHRMALKRFVEKADGKTLRGLLLECFLWEWDSANEEVLKAAAKLYKVKLQTSGKKKGGADAEDEDDEA